MRYLAVAIFLAMSTGTGAFRKTQTPNLSDYVGTYSDQRAEKVEIIAGDEIIRRRRWSQVQTSPRRGPEFTNVVGKKIPFLRDANGKVTGYEESGQFHPRTSLTVTTESAALAFPRRKGQNSPDDYRYQMPADLHDGIAVGDIAKSEISVRRRQTKSCTPYSTEPIRTCIAFFLPARKTCNGRVLLRLQHCAATSASVCDEVRGERTGWHRH